MGRFLWGHYNKNDYNENAFSAIPAGDYRVRIEDVKQKTSATSGNDMLEITLAVSGYRSKLWKYIVLDSSSQDKIRETNQRLGELYNSFNIPHGNEDTDSWIGRVGGVRVRHSKGNDGVERAEVHYFLKRSQVDRLPAWVNPDGNNSYNNAEDFDAAEDTPSDSIDFNSEHIPF